MTTKIQDRNTYVMRRYEIVCPSVDNQGQHVTYPRNFREGLALAGFEGWTQFETVGYWKGKPEPSITFVIYSDGTRGSGCDTLNLLCNIARKAMPDQEFIQVVDSGYITLVEA